MRETRFVEIDDSNFIFERNFRGDPNVGKYKSKQRRATIIIPNHNQAKDLMDEGFNVKFTSPREGEEEGFVPTYFIKIIANYDSRTQPMIYIVPEGGSPVLLDQVSVSEIDGCYATRVRAVLNPYTNKETGAKSLYVQTMYVEAERSDPYGSYYRNNNSPANNMGQHPQDGEEEIPFN